MHIEFIIGPSAETFQFTTPYVRVHSRIIGGNVVYYDFYVLSSITVDSTTFLRVAYFCLAMA